MTQDPVSYTHLDVYKRQVLDGRQRLEALYYALNPYRNAPFIFDWDSMLRACLLYTSHIISTKAVKADGLTMLWQRCTVGLSDYEGRCSYGCKENQ